MELLCLPLYHDRLKPQERRAKAKCLCETSCPAVRRVTHIDLSDSTGKDEEQDDALAGRKAGEANRGWGSLMARTPFLKEMSTHSILTSFTGRGKAFLQREQLHPLLAPSDPRLSASSFPHPGLSIHSNIKKEMWAVETSGFHLSPFHREASFCLGKQCAHSPALQPGTGRTETYTNP